MDIEVRPVPRRIEDPAPKHMVVREEMRAARGLLVGLAFSAIIWLALLVVWLAV